MEDLAAVKGKSNVALLAEGVDRNYEVDDSAIEDDDVALLAEGVDRNIRKHLQTQRSKPRRPPRGGRG